MRLGPGHRASCTSTPGSSEDTGCWAQTAAGSLASSESKSPVVALVKILREDFNVLNLLQGRARVWGLPDQGRLGSDGPAVLHLLVKPWGRLWGSLVLAESLSCLLLGKHFSLPSAFLEYCLK